MAKFYIRFFMLAIIGITVLKGIDSLLVQNEFYHRTYRNFLNDERHYDFVFMGNSLSQTTYRNTYIDSLYNSNSITVGGPAHNFLVTNLIFEKIIEDKKLHPSKLLIIEIGSGQFNPIENDKYKFLQMAPLDEMDYSWDYFKTLNIFFENHEYPKVLSRTIRFHDELAQKIVATQGSIERYYNKDIRGFTIDRTNELNESLIAQKADLYDKAASYKNNIAGSKAKPIGKEYDAIISNMIDKAAEQKINLLFVTAPSISKLYGEKDFGRIKYIEDLLASKKAHHIDFNKNFNELGITWSDFTDLSHLNTYGNSKTTPFLIDYVDTHFKIVKNPVTKVARNVEKKELNNDPELAKVSNWSKIRADITKEPESYFQNDVYKISRVSNDQSSIVNIKKNVGNKDMGYEMSIIAKKGTKGNRMGIRISGKYPNRADALFDLETGTLISVKITGNFEKEFAKIESLQDGWYKCILSAKVNTEESNIFIGPTDNTRSVEGWEGNTKTYNDILVVPSSIEIKERTYR